MMPRLVFLCLSFILFVTAILSVPAYATQLDADPLFSYESQEHAYTFHGCGEVFEFSERISAVRPFYYKDNTTSEVDILYPLGRFSRERGMFIPFYRHTQEDDQDHTELFPVFYGKYEDTSYWGIFPVYGTMHHRFGYERARFVLLPLYADTQIHDQTTYTVLWPIFSYSRDRLFRVFPLYGWKTTQSSTSQYVLWPFIQQSRGPGEKKMDAVLPLFSYDRGPTHRNISILWPLFNYNADSAAKHESADFPWPLFRVASGAYEETRVFPFYWTNTDGRTYSKTHILWPLWSKRSWHYEDTMTEEENTSVLLVNWLTKKTGQDGQTSKSLYLWPFLHSASDGERSEWHFPCIFPLFFDEGFTRVWGPILSVAQGSSDQSSSELSILWRTLFLEEKGANQKFSLSLLFSLTRTPDYRQWGFLGNTLRFREDLKEP